MANVFKCCNCGDKTPIYKGYVFTLGWLPTCQKCENGCRHPVNEKGEDVSLEYYSPRTIEEEKMFNG